MIKIDLLQDAERRYQGAVSHRFIVVAVVLTLTMAVLGFNLYHGWRYFDARRERAWLTGNLSNLAPRQAQLTADETVSRRLRNVQAELDQWRAVRLDWNDLLLALAQAIPANMQLTQLEMRDDFKPGDDRAEKPPPPALIARLDLSGRAHGAEAEPSIVELVDRLRQWSGAGQPYENVTLASMRRDLRSEDQRVRLFGLNLAGQERRLE